MKAFKNSQKSSAAFFSTSFGFKKKQNYFFHPDDDFREDHSWGMQTANTESTKPSKSDRLDLKRTIA